MTTRTPFLSLLAATLALATASHAFAQTPAGLTGTVQSSEEGAMEGVVVSAKKDGSVITTSVVSGAKGAYSFPADRLEAGHYTITARAAGYDLAGPTAADVTPGKTANAAVSLKKTANRANQMTNAEWMMSIPGKTEHKTLLRNCISCHTLQRIVSSTHDSNEFLQVFERMQGYYPGATPTLPQRLTGVAKRGNITRGGGGIDDVADWLASINLSKQKAWSWDLKTLPRLTGASTRVIYTEYDLPRKQIQPHDVIIGKDGMVWYADFGQMFLGKMDPKTGKLTEYAIPVTKKDSPKGTLDLEMDRAGDLWVAVMYQGAIAKFDAKKGTFRMYTPPKDWDSDANQLGHIAVEGTHVDGKVWMKNSDKNRIFRMDAATGVFEDLGQFTNPFTDKRIGSYGVHSDSKNNLYLLDYSSGNIGRVEAGTKKLTVYPTPTPNSKPRRGRIDAKDRMWFAEYWGDAIGMLDPATAEIKEWKVPTPYSAPYDAVYDNKRYAWTGSMTTDRVSRLDTQTGTYTEYELPRPTNIRRVFVDEAQANRPLWIGSNHGASIVKVEVLD